VIAVLALAAVAAALPEGTARYRAELGGIPVGAAELRIACAGARCSARSSTMLRLPEESGGGLVEEAVEVEVDRDGRYRGGPLAVRRRGVPSSPPGLDGAVPAAVAEVVLAGEAARSAGDACVPFFVEGQRAPRQACARRALDGRVRAVIGLVSTEIAPGADGFPAEVVVAGRFRWTRDPEARVPARPPRLAGTRVPGPADPREARAFCGLRADPPVDEVRAAALPSPRASGESCREKTAAWLAEARARGLEGRTAVGVAWDGERFAWHAWAEIRDGAGWIPVDPSFGQRPARGPRFTVARYGDDEAPAREAAGEQILRCWGSAVGTAPPRPSEPPARGPVR
jgi:hypothetical protein